MRGRQPNNAFPFSLPVLVLLWFFFGGGEQVCGPRGRKTAGGVRGVHRAVARRRVRGAGAEEEPREGRAESTVRRRINRQPCLLSSHNNRRLSCLYSTTTEDGKIQARAYE